MRRMTSWLTFLAALCVAVGVAWAASGDLDSVLGDVEWGDGKDAVVSKMKQQRIEALRNRRDLQHDRIALQNARKDVIDKFKKVEDSYTKLEGEETGYEVSVISGEFTKNAGEALMKVDDQTAQRFYFFKDEKLYKLVVAYRQNRLQGISFENFLQRVISKYGKPDEVQRAKIDGERKLARAQWSGDSTMLEVRNEREFFGTFVMVFSDKTRVKKLRAKEGEFGGSGKEAGVSERVKALSEESGGDQKDVVEGMIGEDIEVTLGEPSEKEQKKDKSDADKADEEADETEESADGADTTEKRASKSKDSSNETASQSSDEKISDNASSSSEKRDEGGEKKQKDELIVY